MFGAERDPAFGHPGAQGAGPIFAMWHKWLGDQWSIGDWAGMRVAAAHELSSHLVGRPWPVDPPQNLREYDPEWGRAFSTGSAVGGCDHDRMLSLVRVPVLFTHHSRHVDAHTGRVLEGAQHSLDISRPDDSACLGDEVAAGIAFSEFARTGRNAIRSVRMLARAAMTTANKALASHGSGLSLRRNRV